MIRDTKYFRFGPVRQERGAKHLRPADLLEAVNVSQAAKAGVYAKRYGFSRTGVTFSDPNNSGDIDGGSIGGYPVCVTQAEYGSSLMRDAAEQLWAKSSSGTAWLYRGKRKSIWPETQTVLARRYTAPRPFSCVVGTRVWIFAIGTSAYDLTIVNTTTGQVETPPVSVTATNILSASAVYNGIAAPYLIPEPAGGRPIPAANRPA